MTPYTGRKVKKWMCIITWSWITWIEVGKAEHRSHVEHIRGSPCLVLLDFVWGVLQGSRLCYNWIALSLLSTHVVKSPNWSGKSLVWCIIVKSCLLTHPCFEHAKPDLRQIYILRLYICICHHHKSQMPIMIVYSWWRLHTPVLMTSKIFTAI